MFALRKPVISCEIQYSFSDVRQKVYCYSLSASCCLLYEEYFESVFLSCRAAFTLRKKKKTTNLHTQPPVLVIFPGEGRRRGDAEILLLLDSSNSVRMPCPHFFTSEILLLAARCAETPDDSIYSLRVFNRLREIWVEYMKAAQLHTLAGNAQKAYCCLEFLLQSGESRTGTESSTTELEE